MTKPILFTNFTSEDFVCKYDGQDFVFPAGESQYISAVEACHFAKHLCDREMHAMNPPKQVTDPYKHELIKKVSPFLKFAQDKHYVVPVGDVEVAAPKEPTAAEKLKAEIELANLQNQKVEEEALADPSTEEPQEDVFNMELATRAELNKEAIRLGHDKSKVIYAPNKDAVKAMIQGEDTSESPDEATFEGV